MKALQSQSVWRVREALLAAGSRADVVELSASARSAAEAAAALGVPLGAIVKSLVFTVGGQAVLVLIGGDRFCREAMLPRVFGMDGIVRRADAQAVRAATGFAIGGVSPVGLTGRLPVAIDAAMARHAVLYAAAGHPRCVFPTTAAELERLTGGRVSLEVAGDP